MSATATTVEPGNTVLVITKPFVDSDKRKMQEVGIIKVDTYHWHVTKNGRGHYCIPVETIEDFEVLS